MPRAYLGTVMSQALLGVDSRRDPARERLAPLLSELRARKRSVRPRTRRMRLGRRWPRLGEDCA